MFSPQKTEFNQSNIFSIREDSKRQEYKSTETENVSPNFKTTDQVSKQPTHEPDLQTNKMQVDQEQ